MPELPEVETTRLGLTPHIVGRTITSAACRVNRLRLPLDSDLPSTLAGQTIMAVTRRGKYLLFSCTNGTLIIHLGMTGHLRLFTHAVPAAKYYHFEFYLDSGQVLRLSDPRKFGTVVWTNSDPLQHHLLANLGPEPLENSFDASYLYRVTRKRRIAIKVLLMDNHLVVGIGNIYANETCFRAEIDPAKPALELTSEECSTIVSDAKKVLLEAIQLGGTTLRDYLDSSGKPGYFSLNLKVYGRSTEPCLICGTIILRSTLGGRATFWCPTCQKK